MRIAAVATSLPTELPTNLPLRIEQQTSRSSAIVKLCILAPAAIALLYPFVLIGQYLLFNPQVQAHLAGRPQAILPLLAGLAFWTVLFAWPLQRIAQSLASARTVDIDSQRATVTDRSMFSGQSWSLPLNAYAGLAHHVRASISGVRHELILTHEDPARNILIAMAPRFSPAEIEHLAHLLDCAEISSRDLYRLRLMPSLRRIGGAREEIPEAATA